MREGLLKKYRDDTDSGYLSPISKDKGQESSFLEGDTLNELNESAI
jgi:hypothetical protein